MATETISRLVDDLDGGNADRTVAFGWDGKTYTIDLSKKNIAAFEKALKPYLAAARPARRARRQSASRSGSRAASTANKSANVATIREWSRANGYQVSDRGRIAASIVAAYESAQ
jgi:Lsr2